MEQPEGPKIEFNTRVVKQGNSLCIRLPKEFAEQTEIYEGSYVKTTIQKTDIYNLPEWMLKLYRKHLNKYIRELSDRELNLIIHMAGVKHFLTKDIKNAKKKKEAEELYLKTVELERSKDLVEKFKKFEAMSKSKETEIQKIFVEKIKPELESNKEWGNLYKSTLRKAKDEKN